MDIFLVLLLLTESVLGDKLNRGYLPPPGAHLSAGDLNHSDLPFELPNHSARTEPNSTPNEEMGNYFISSPGSEPPVSYEYNSQTSTTPASATNSISEYFSTPSAQVSTVPELISVTTESNLPQVTDKSQRFNGPFSFGRVNNFTRTGEAMPGTVIEEIPARFKNIHSSFPISSQSDLEPNMYEKEIPKMEYNYPYMKSGEVEIFDNQQKQYSPQIYEPNLPSAGKIESHNNDGNALITNQNNYLGSDGFSYSFDTSNGMHTDVVGTANDGMKSKGSFSYTGDDGKLYKMEYTADENGFQPIGAHLPTPPPIPEEIKKVIEQAYRNKAAGIVDDGSYNEEKYGYRNYMPRNKEMKQNKDIITKKTMVQPTNIFNDNYSNNIDKSSTTNMPVNNEIIPVQVIYDHGYTYNRPQNMLPVSYQTEYSTSESPKLPLVNIKSIVIDGENTYNTSPNNAFNNTEKSNIFEPSDEVRINENKPFSPSVNNRKSENYKTTTFPTTYINFNNLSDDPSRVTNSQTETTNFPTTATPNYYRNANTGTYKSRYMPVDNEVISTANPITTASPRVKTMPVYIQTQVRGENFSGPKQLPTYNPKSGYYY